MCEVLLWVSILVNNIEDLMFRVIGCFFFFFFFLPLSVSVETGPWFQGCGIKSNRPLRLSILWRLIKIRATG